MSAIRWRPNGVCAATLGEVPGGTVYVKTNPNFSGPKGAYPVRWLGFMGLSRSKKVPYTQKAKLVATGVTNGDVVCSTWVDLGPEQYVLGLLIQVGAAHEFGAWAIVDDDDWPIVGTEGGPRLTIIDSKQPSVVAPFRRKVASSG